MTVAYYNYLKQNVVFGTAGMVAHHGLIKYALGELTNEPIEKRLNDEEKAKVLIEQILFASAVDNFNCYLSEALVEVLNKDPRPLSGKKFDAKEAFNFENIDDLRKRILEKFIADLGYQKIDVLVEFLEKNFGVKSLSNWLTKLRLNRLIQIRNIITHNRGIVNKTYLYKSSSKRDVETSKVWVQGITKPASYLLGLATKVDRELEQKFFK